MNNIKKYIKRIANLIGAFLLAGLEFYFSTDNKRGIWGWYCFFEAEDKNE